MLRIPRQWTEKRNVQKVKTIKEEKKPLSFSRVEDFPQKVFPPPPPHENENRKFKTEDRKSHFKKGWCEVQKETGRVGAF